MKDWRSLVPVISDVIKEYFLEKSKPLEEKL